MPNFRKCSHAGAWGLVAAWINLAPMSACAETARLPPATRSDSAFEQTIPLVVILATDQKAACVALRLAWKPWPQPAPTDDPVVFEFESPEDSRSREMLRAQLRVAAMAAAMAWQHPWEAAHWIVGEVPAIEEPAEEAALAVALIATASNTVFPRDATLIASLYPDGSLGPVSHITGRIEAAAAAGLKRAILSNLQRFEVSPDGTVLNVRDFAQARHVDCLFVDHLAEAAELALQRALPVPTDTAGSPRYDGDLFNYLALQCRKELAPLQASLPGWPRAPDRLAALHPAQQDLWRKVFRHYEDGLDAYRAGLLYVTRERLSEANAQLGVIAAANARKGKFDYRAEDARATKLRQAMAARMNRPAIDRDELQSALLLAEEDNWLGEINARVEGAQILARQVFDARSHADDRQKEFAQTLLQNAAAEAECRLQQTDFYPSIEAVIRRRQPARIPGRAAAWSSRLTPTFLAAAELLNHGLKLHADEYREALLFDRRLATHVRMLRDARAEWEDTLKRRARQLAKIQPVQAAPATVKVGFVPGPAYAPPTPPVPPPSPQSLSPTAHALVWVNKYCEVAALDQKYLGPGGVFEPSSLQWKNQNHAALQNLLQNAEMGARRGIALAARTGLDPSVLLLIYERASCLRTSDEDEGRLEALRHFWRCALLGNLCWQLASATKTAPVETLVAKAGPATAPPPSEAPPFAIPAFPAILIDEEAGRPPAVSAIPLTTQELNGLETSP